MFVKDYALNLGLTFSKRWSILILVSIILVVEGEVMSTVNLLILGVLMEQPMNAYEMQKVMDSRYIKRWTKISTPSIYRNLVTLCERGYIDGEVVKEGEMPQKTIYTINEKGKACFFDLMEKCIDKPETVYLPFTAFIANIEKLDDATGKAMLDQLYQTFYDKAHRLETVAKGSLVYQGTSVIDLNRRMYLLFCDWIKEFKENYYG